MKSNTTMLALARAKAYAKDMQKIAVTDDITVIGYAVTMKELSALYKENGFTSPTVVDRHLQIWKDLGLVKTYYQDIIIMVVPLITDYEQIEDLVLAQKDQGSSVVAILPKLPEASA